MRQADVSPLREILNSNRLDSPSSSSNRPGAHNHGTVKLFAGARF